MSDRRWENADKLRKRGDCRARIGIITCSNCTGDLDCASVVCLGDMRRRKGLFKDYPREESLELIGIINCAGSGP
ncbi:MAG: CGGC domain-containing protein [Bacillota bacterium]